MPIGGVHGSESENPMLVAMFGGVHEYIGAASARVSGVCAHKSNNMYILPILIKRPYLASGRGSLRAPPRHRKMRANTRRLRLLIWAHELSVATSWFG